MKKDDLYTEYNDEKNKIPWVRLVVTVLVLVLIVFIILLIIKGCSKNTLRENIIEAAQNYYGEKPQDFPKEVGECKQITLSTLENAGLIESDDFSSCDRAATYVNVCYLENSEYNYAAILSCEEESVNYSNWKDGNVSDLTEGSDVRFTFQPQYYTLADEVTGIPGNKKYYPGDESNSDLVNNYYVTSPAVGYDNKDSENVGYKWYTESQVKSYWNNGEYSATAPVGYMNNEGKTTITNYSDTMPASATYRTINEVTLYRYRVVSPLYRFKCIVPGTTEADGYILSPTHCQLNQSGFTQIAGAYYSCDNGATTVPYGTVCADYTEWSKDACTTDAVKGVFCESKTVYEYTDTVYKWYTMNTVKKYYPSNSSTAEGENTYYVTSPVSGAIKDETTMSTVYKFYKSDTNGNLVEMWVNVTDGYVTLEEMIEAYKKLGYEVNSLSDIKAIEELKYEVKMQYREIEE